MLAIDCYCLLVDYKNYFLFILFLHKYNSVFFLLLKSKKNLFSLFIQITYLTYFFRIFIRDKLRAISEDF